MTDDQPLNFLSRLDWAAHVAAEFRTAGMEVKFIRLLAAKAPTPESPESPADLASMLNIDIKKKRPKVAHWWRK